jgi:hypothetical protein
MQISRIRHLRIIGVAVLAFAAVLTVGGGSASAAPQVITMTPTSLDRVIEPGGSYKGTFRILNQGQSSYTFHVYAAPYHVKGEDYTPDFTPLPGKPDVASWITFSVKTVHLNPGQSAPVNYTINMPKGTQPGGYYAAAFAETRLPPKPNSVVLNERVGEIFYLQAAGPVAHKGKLLTWQSNFFQTPPLTSALRLENNGGAHFPATINYQVQDVFGHDKYRLKTVKEVLPQTIRRVTIPWKTTPAIGIFKVKGTVSFLNQKQTLSTKWVLVMSKTVRIILLVIIALIVLFIVFRKAYRRRPTKKSKK